MAGELRPLAGLSLAALVAVPHSRASPVEANAHWAWRPVSAVSEHRQVDGFIDEKLRETGLSRSPEADRRTLIRRLSFDLHGLPPSPEDIEAFVDDPNPDAYERLVDRLLASPHYGERFARHWLDLAHYADTHGFERDQRRPNAWRYRDYLIDSFNADKPYGRFLEEQIAGDVLWPDDPQAVIATGFLAAGPWDFVGQVETQSPELRRSARSLDLDDMATQVMTATVGVTINCARCHDHKLDPISQIEYYQLQAAFAGARRGDRTVPAPELARLRTRRSEVAARIRRLDPAIDLADVVGGGDGTGTGTHGLGIDPRRGTGTSARMGFLEDVEPNTFLPVAQPLIDGVFVPRGDDGRTSIPVTSTGIALSGIAGADGRAWDAIRNGPVNSQHSPELGGVRFGEDGESLIGLHANAGITFDLDAARRMLGTGELRFTGRVGYFGHESENAFADARILVDGETVVAHLGLKRVDGLIPIDIALPEAARFLTLLSTDGGNGISMDQVGFGTPRLRPVNREPTGIGREELARCQAELQDIDAEIGALEGRKVFAVVPDEDVPEVQLLQRGDPESPLGPPLLPRAPSLIAGLDVPLGDRASPEGERRAALARWITHPDNPLTPRVIVNRMWQWHFGRGLVDTPSDLGLGGGAPTHPELLDWLASELAASGGSLKAIHRLILNSATYRQESRFAHDAAGCRTDADNRLLWRQNARRIEAEAVRDAVLSVSGTLNPDRGGPGFEDFIYREAYAPEYTYITADQPSLWRRSIYRYIVRTTPDRFLTTLDCPDPANLTPTRQVTTTPLQSLALYNNEFTLRQARHFAWRVERDCGDSIDRQVERAFLLAFGRRPSSLEAALSSAFVGEHGLFAFCRTLFNANEFVHVD